MPIYDFKCPSCGTEKEKLVASWTQHAECPNCGSKMEKQVSGSQSFYFKGQGAYSEKSMYPRKTG